MCADEFADHFIGGICPGSPGCYVALSDFSIEETSLVWTRDIVVLWFRSPFPMFIMVRASIYKFKISTKL